MGLYSWSLTKRRVALIAQLTEIPDDAGKDLSMVLEEALADHIRRKLKTHNPQTTIADYEDPRFKALPNLWLIESLSSLNDVDTPTLREIGKKAKQLDYLVDRRLSMRGEV